jgi:transposase
LKLFQDQQRSGRPNVYTAEQVCEIIKVALEEPEKSGRPISHWTARELADEVNMRKITDSISNRTVGRILNQVDIKPHRISYWLNPNIEDQAKFKEKVMEICAIYREAIKLKQQGINVVSVDEKTGIQALERMKPSKPVRPGSPEKIEFEYQRRGTLCLIPSFEVATGKIIQYRIGETRDEEDFAQHIRKTIEINPQESWIFIVDQLNTHKSVSLVKLVAQLCAIEDDLGKKRKRGILKDMESREKFLTDKSHRIRFVYTPKHCSWLNQVEIWFGILEKKMLKRTSFNSQDKLQEKLIDFIVYFNKTMRKPFKWTYSGKALKA